MKRKYKRIGSTLRFMYCAARLAAENAALRGYYAMIGNKLSRLYREIAELNERLEEQTARADAFEELFEQQKDKTRDITNEMKFYKARSRN